MQKILLGNVSDLQTYKEHADDCVCSLMPESPYLFAETIHTRFDICTDTITMNDDIVLIFVLVIVNVFDLNR